MFRILSKKAELIIHAKIPYITMLDSQLRIKMN